MCGDIELRDLDQTMDGMYRYLLRSPRGKEHLRSVQRRWLSSDRAACVDAACLRKVYTMRIAELDREMLDITTPGQTASIDAKQVCEAVIKLANRKALPLHAIPSRVSQENTWRLRVSSGAAPVQFIGASTGGTCPSIQLQNEALADPAGDTRAEVDDPEEQLRWSWWGGGDYPAFVNGKLLAITADFLDMNLVRLVSWIRPDGRIVPLCSTETRTTKSISAAREKSVCTAIATDAAVGPDWEPGNSMDLDEGEAAPRGAGTPTEVKVADIDLDGDGRKERIAHLAYDSGAGCGAHTERLRVLDANRPGFSKQPIDQVVAELEASEVNLWRIGAKYYVESYEPRRGGKAYRITATGAQEVCRFSWRGETSITKLW